MMVHPKVFYTRCLKNIPKCAAVFLIMLMMNPSFASGIFVGKAAVNITPDLPVALHGQMHVRLATKVDNPVTANIIVLSTDRKKNLKETTVWVSCDLVSIPTKVIDGVRDLISSRIPGFNTQRILLNGTHTHTAPVAEEGVYLIPKEAIQPEDYVAFLTDRIAGAIVEAWNNQTKASVTWGLDYAKVAYNRRAAYKDGSAKMYGNTSSDDFRQIEGAEDESVNSLFFWDEKGVLLAACINVACPSQIVESRSTVNADYWHFVREKLKDRFGQQVCVLGWVGAAGNQAPRPMYNHLAEYRMAQLKSKDGIKDFKNGKYNFQTEVYLNEIANRIVDAVIRSYEAVQGERENNVVIHHDVEKISLPMRLVTDKEYKNIQQEIDADSDNEEKVKKNYTWNSWRKEAIARYENQKKNSHPIYETEVHVMRLGDIVIATNPFELFTEYGVQMKARSRALQTFVIQLAGPGTYLPTRQAVEGGHYSAIVQSNVVGPEGGQELVEQTLRMINDQWE